MVLYFYPKDATRGCTIEANQFTQFINEFEQLDTVIFGVSKDDCASHVDFINKFNLKVGLLADTEGAMCEAYGVWQEKERNGVRKTGIVRYTFCRVRCFSRRACAGRARKDKTMVNSLQPPMYAIDK